MAVWARTLRGTGSGKGTRGQQCNTWELGNHALWLGFGGLRALFHPSTVLAEPPHFMCVPESTKPYVNVQS